MEIEDVVELRVHGVSGTPPEELLDRPLVTLVAGDTTAGFYRPRLYAERNDDYPVGVAEPEIGGPTLEGYCWGGLTSGAPSRAFWLLLLPFTLGNVAPRLRPAACGPRRTWLVWYLSRLLALTLTIVLVAGFVGIGVDLIGWQCSVKGGRCASASPGWLMDPITRLGTGRRVLTGATLPLLGLLLLWFLSKRTITRFEDVSIQSGPATAQDRAEATEVGLGSRWMWDNAAPVRRLRALHLQAGMAATLAMTGAATHGFWQWTDGLLALIVAGYAVAALSRASFTAHRVVGLWQDISYGIWGALGVASIGTAWWLLRCDDLPDRPLRCRGSGRTLLCRVSGLPHFAETLVWLLLIELGLVLGLVAVTVGRSLLSNTVFGEPGPRTGLRGMGTAAIALLAVFLASVFTAGAYLFAGAWLSTGSLRPSLAAVSAVSRRFAVPEVIVDAGLAYALAVGLLIVALVAFLLRVAFSWVRISISSWLMVPDSYTKDYPGQPTDARRNPRVRSVLHAFYVGRLVDVAGPGLGLVTLLGAVLTYVFGVLLFLEHALHVDGPAYWLADPATARSLSSGIEPGFFSRVALQGKGAYLAVWTLVLLVALGAAAFRVTATRRSVGVLWDLASFWPRLSHPLAAPCYAERTVPDLVARIRWHTSTGRGVVLAGHSQGSVISAATIAQLQLIDSLETGPPTVDQVSLLTFGSVLRRLYGRYFPTYFAPELFVGLGAGLMGDSGPRWWNLWRYSDYLGGPMLSGPPPRSQPHWVPAQPLPSSPAPCLDLHLIDPAFAPPPGDTAEPKPGRHSDFWAVPQFQAAVVGLAKALPEDGVGANA